MKTLKPYIENGYTHFAIYEAQNGEIDIWKSFKGLRAARKWMSENQWVLDIYTAKQLVKNFGNFTL